MAAVCRACTCLLFGTDEIVPLFEAYKNIYNLPNILSDLVHAKVDDNNEITKYVCRTCAEKIVELHQFHQMYLESERKLRDLMKSDKKSAEDEVNQLLDLLYSGTSNFDLPLQWQCSTCLEMFYDQSLMDTHKRTCDLNFKLTYFEDAQETGGFTNDTIGITMDHTVFKIEEKQCSPDIQIKVPFCCNNNNNNSNNNNNNNNNTITFNWKCRKCGSEFNSSDLLLEHDVLCTSTETLQPTPSLTQHKMHESAQRLHIELPKNWSCQKCDEQFTSKEILNEHKYSTHRNPMKIYKFQRNYHKNDRDEFVCDLCEKAFTTRGKLNGHMRNHNGEKALCNICGKWFSQKTNLYKHHRTVHLKEKNYQCPLLTCEQRFDSSYRLKIHLNRHENKRQFECKICASRFITSSALTRHEKSIHSDVKSHSCTICSKAFKMAENLRAHMVTHTGIRPFHCTHCGMGFARKQKLEVHMDEFHEDVI